MSEIHIELNPEKENYFRNIRCIKIDTMSLREPVGLANALQIDGVYPAQIARILYQNKIEIPLDSYVVSWRGSTRTLSNVMIEDFEIGSMHGTIIRDSYGNPVGDYLRLIDETEGLGFDEEDNERRRNALHLIIIDRY